MSKTDSIRHDLNQAVLDYDRLLSLSLLLSAEEHIALERLGIRISVLQQQLRDAEDEDGITWDEDGHAGKWAHVADTLALDDN